MAVTRGSGWPDAWPLPCKGSPGGPFLTAMEVRMLRPALPLAPLSFLSLLGCGATVFRPSARFDVDDARQIDDGDIRAAFEAHPQLSTPTQVAYYTLDPAHQDQIDARLRRVPGVSRVYRIPTLLVTGRRRFEEAPRWSSDPPREVSLERLRLLAARARCDLLVVFDYGYRTERTANGLIALDVLVLPALFVPFLDARAESYLDAYVIDTRNGYLYGHLSADEHAHDDGVTIWSRSEDRMLARQWRKLLGLTEREIARLLATPAAAGRS
ncbi:MAG: hypothetical protein HYY06_10615 [Deltaproteobacteria bacterium]|nr:hypothetical protein [Deltaproteobacteria bacterium]